VRVAVAILLVLGVSPALAHKPSDSYLALRVEGSTIRGQWDIALRDLDFAIGLDDNGDGSITWGELRAHHADIAAYALARLTLRSGGADCPTRATGFLVDDHSDGAYSVMRFAADCPAEITTLEASYSLFADLDPQHKGLLRLEYGSGTRTAIFSPERATQRFELAKFTRLVQFLDYGREGVWHIWVGFDHILFLLSLLLPAVLVLERRAWRAIGRFAPAFWDVFKIVTSFTVAHSITLSLAALGVISLPSRLVESAIAASVVLAALNNVVPLVHGRRWMVAFAFGLIHGFGFASVLRDLGLPQGALLLALVGFNLGVEVGQLAIVSAFLPIAYGLRASWFYRRLVFVGGSLVIVLVAGIWLIERAFNMKIIST
jgi:HupE / UreJ protein